MSNQKAKQIVLFTQSYTPARVHQKDAIGRERGLLNVGSAHRQLLELGLLDTQQARLGLRGLVVRAAVLLCRNRAQSKQAKKNDRFSRVQLLEIVIALR